MAGSLDGTRIIDFGQYIAGPLAAMMLGDQGAEVIRVDPPGGPRYETPANAVWNRGKRRITLDLTNELDLATARQLVATADVVIENFRPGVMARLALSADELIEANPALIYCSLPGFASDDPRAGMPAWEGVVGAATASYQPREAGDEPHYTRRPARLELRGVRGGEQHRRRPDRPRAHWARPAHRNAPVRRHV